MEILRKFDRGDVLPLVLKKRFCYPWTKLFRQLGITETMASEEKLREMATELIAQQPEARVFPELKRSLELLQRKNVRLTLVSAQNKPRTMELLETHDLLKFFEIVESGSPKKAEILQSINSRLDIPPEESAYIGDQENDVIQAKQAGWVAIGFCMGMHSPERLAKSGSNFLIYRHLELLDLPIFKGGQA